MKLIWSVVLLCISEVISKDIKFVKSKNPLPYIRRQVEEIVDPTSTTISELVSFLIKNVRKVFEELHDIESTETITRTSLIENSTSMSGLDVKILNHVTESMAVQSSKLKTFSDAIENSNLIDNINFTQFQSIPDYKSKDINITEASLFDIQSFELHTSMKGLTEKELMSLSKNLMFFETDRMEGDNYLKTLAASSSDDYNNQLRSCLYCNNVASVNCNDPKNKLISSKVCEHDEDLCVSQHTPFGVVDRGCYSINNDLATYVCACNLCNYISISEMPYVFSKRSDWINNVVELSRSRYLRKSVLKDMACLSCETNRTVRDMLDTANCLEGNIGYLSTVVCKENEICAVKALRKDGYMWRGCVETPQYNYWWALCDSDMCNNDELVTITDEL